MPTTGGRPNVAVLSRQRHRRLLAWIGIPVALLAVACAVGFTMAGAMVHFLQPRLKERVLRSLRSEFGGSVFLDRFEISVENGIQVQGGGLRIYASPDISGPSTPLIAIKSFELKTTWRKAFAHPLHVGLVYVHGLAINVPPPAMRKHRLAASTPFGKSNLRIDRMLCDDSTLTVNSGNPAKSPKFFLLTRIAFQNVGVQEPTPYQALLTNAVPVGEIRSSGTFGPWDTDSPADSNIAGTYVYDHADLYPLKGIGGILHSTGNYSGPLDHVNVHGKADVPNFSLDTANRPVPLAAEFSAVVDGTSGDTYLNSVVARLGSSNFACRGSIVHEKDKGHTIDLDVDIPHGRIQDFLALAMRTWPTVMTGVIQTTSHLHIRPGKESATRKMEMTGSFSLTQLHFTNPRVEDKVDMLSLRANGKPKLAKPGAADVHSQMTGNFNLKDGRIAFRDLNYELPGADISLNGKYSMDGETYEFTGEARTKAELSQMVNSKWKSLLLKPIDPFFHRNGAGAEIPIKISGTWGEPHFGIRLRQDGNSNGH